MRKKSNLIILILILNSCNTRIPPSFGSFYNNPNISFLTHNRILFIDHSINLNDYIQDDDLMEESVYIDKDIYFTTLSEKNGMYSLNFYVCDYYGNNIELVDQIFSDNKVYLKVTDETYSYYTMENELLNKPYNMNPYHISFTEKTNKSISFRYDDNEFTIDKETLKKYDFGKEILKYFYYFEDIYTIYNSKILFSIYVDYEIVNGFQCVLLYDIITNVLEFGYLFQDIEHYKLIYRG